MDGSYIKWFTLCLSLPLHWGINHISTALGQEFELYEAASGVEDKLQKQALLLYLAAPGVHEIFKMYSNKVKGDAKELDKMVTCLLNHFKVQENVPLA